MPFHSNATVLGGQARITKLTSWKCFDALRFALLFMTVRWLW